MARPPRPSGLGRQSAHCSLGFYVWAVVSGARPHCQGLAGAERCGGYSGAWRCEVIFRFGARPQFGTGVSVGHGRAVSGGAFGF
eukprot:1440335-Pyramimonas_sp.AAC.1